MLTTLRALAVLIALTGTVWAQTSPPVGAVLKLLLGGGYVIVFRHGATHADQADTDPLNLDDVTKQRQLNDAGRADAKAVGEAFKAAEIPIGKSYSSRFQRAVESARLIGGKDPQATLDVTEGGLVVSPNENNRRAQALRALVAAAPDPGTNTLIVTHKPNILDAFGKDWFDIKEGEPPFSSPSQTASTCWSLASRSGSGRPRPGDAPPLALGERLPQIVEGRQEGVEHRRLRLVAP